MFFLQINLFTVLRAQNCTQHILIVLKIFLAQLMSAEEVKICLQEKFAEVLATKNKGQIMKAVMGELKGKADGKVINQVVGELCK